MDEIDEQFAALAFEGMDPSKAEPGSVKRLVGEVKEAIIALDSTDTDGYRAEELRLALRGVGVE